MARYPDQTGRRGKAASLSQLVAKVGDRTFRKRGFIHSQIITGWSHVVGPSLASVTAPESLRFAPGSKRGGTLMVRCDGGAALEVQHHSALIIERINIFFGYSAVAKLAIRQGPLPASARQARPKPAVRALVKAEEERLSASLKPIENQALKDALDRLGRTVITS